MVLSSGTKKDPPPSVGLLGQGGSDLTVTLLIETHAVEAVPVLCVQGYHTTERGWAQTRLYCRLVVPCKSYPLDD